MASPKVIGLDLAKRDGFNKALTGRVGDKGEKYLFRLFNNGALFDLSQAEQIALLGLTPSGYYVDAVGFPQADGTIQVELPSAFNAELGYFQRCFIRVVLKTGETLSTQDMIYYSYGNADISAGGGKDYIGRVEELIKELNEMVDNFKSDLSAKYDKLVADLKSATDALEALEKRMKALEDGGALMKSEANNLYMNIRSTPITNNDWNTLTAVGTYSVENATGANKPDESATWGTLLVQSKKHNDSMLTQLFVGSNAMWYRRKGGEGQWGNWFKLGNAVDFYTKKEVDDKLAKVKPPVATGAEVTAGTDNTKFLTPKSVADSNIATTDDVNTLINNSIKQEFYYDTGATLTDTKTSGVTVPIGTLMSKNTPVGGTDLFTLNSDNTITVNKDATFKVQGGATLVAGDTNPTDYIYLQVVVPNKPTKDFIMQGSSKATNGTLRLTWSAMGMVVVSAKKGDKIKITASIRANKQAFAITLTALELKEVQGV